MMRAAHKRSVPGTAATVATMLLAMAAALFGRGDSAMGHPGGARTPRAPAIRKEMLVTMGWLARRRADPDVALLHVSVFGERSSAWPDHASPAIR